MQRHTLISLLQRLRRDASGNILVMTAVSLTTFCFAFGFIVDFSRAEAAQTELNAIADPAAGADGRCHRNSGQAVYLGDLRIPHGGLSLIHI